MKLYLLRHGETNWNTIRRLQGTLDVPLNEKGRALAELSGQNMKDIPFSAAFASTLSRAYETAGLILQYNDYFKEQTPAYLAELSEEKKAGLVEIKGCSVLRDARLREMELGSWEGWIAPKVPGRGLSDYWEDRSNSGFPEGMECADDLLIRAKDFLDDVTHRPELQDRHVLAVTHGGFLRALLNVLTGGTVFGAQLFRNCEVAVAEIDREGNLVSIDKQLYYDPELAFKGETY